jgi:DNA uptake protein ComE-like DNA-binding protein
MNYFTSSDRKGLLFLSLLIIIIQLLYYYIDFEKEEITVDKQEILSFQNEIDSLKLIEIEKRKPKIYPFNPSFLTDYKAYKLGMSPLEYDRLQAFRKEGKYINSIKEFQTVTGISDSLLATMSPYFKFPDWVVKKQRAKKTGNLSNKNTLSNQAKKDFPKEKQDLNTATPEELIKIKGIGDKLAKRIIKYREVLKGYSDDSQLYEVWYLDKEVANRVLQRFTVLTKPNIQRININEASFKEVLHLPYIDYKLTKKIFDLRNELAEIQSLEELKQIDSFPIDKFDRISLYLKAE